MKWYKIPSSAIRTKTPVQLLQLGGHPFCLIHEQGEWFATAARCPHAGANLAVGWCEDGRLVCPYHRHSFDLKSGKGATGQNNFISIYPLEEREDGIYIQLPQNLFQQLIDIFN